MVAQIEKPIGISVEASKRYSLADYFAMELASEIRHEFRDGEIVPMTGGMPNHNRIIRNLCALLASGSQGTSYEVFVTDQRLWIPGKRLHTYPDVMVIDGELQLEEGRRDTVTNPLLIVEVLSESTQAYDKGDKFVAYRTIPSFKEYVLVSQYGRLLEHYTKTSEKEWVFREYDEMDVSMRLVTIDLELMIADIYDRVVFEGIDGLGSKEEAL